MKFTVLLLAFAALAMVPASKGASADTDWAVILEFDRGPQRTPTSRQEALDIARTHFAKQQTALRAFIAAYPQDPRVIDARLRFAGILAALGKMEENPKLVADAMKILTAMEQDTTLTPEQRADVGFRRISLLMQNAQGNALRLRSTILEEIQSYVRRFPQDRRSPRLLVEVATLWDDAPVEKRRILEQARALSREDELNLRIADDVNRIERVGRPLDVRFLSMQGTPVDLAKYRGRPVALVFWAADSPQSILWLRTFRAALPNLPSSQLVVLTVNLDTDREAMRSVMKELQFDWPTHFDGKGWENTVARPLGINALPTLWMIDKRGVLRTLNARDSYETWIRKLSLENE